MTEVILIFIMIMLFAVIVYQGIIGHHNKSELLLFIQDQQQAWNDERQQLLDRIQAPSFAEYKHQEIKVIKAQKDEPEKPVFHLE